MICGIVAAATAPWTNRAAMSTVMPGANPRTAELRLKTMIAREEHLAASSQVSRAGLR